MKAGPVSVSDKTALIVVGVGTLLIIGVLLYIKKKVGDVADNAKKAAADVADYVAHDAVNVTSRKNVANVVTNTVVKALGVTGTNDYTGKPNTIGEGVEEAKRSISSWLGFK
ncbi:MAG: hypothetical protein RLZZ182_1842 [Pseudomonadota bacterium]|jgi:hypothetical protein